VHGAVAVGIDADRAGQGAVVTIEQPAHHSAGPKLIRATWDRWPISPRDHAPSDRNNSANRFRQKRPGDAQRAAMCGQVTIFLDAKCPVGSYR
jgi:hypothetical protein